VNPGVRVFDAASGAYLAGPVPCGLPPFELVLLPGATSDTPPGHGGPPAEAALGSPYPNPSAGSVRLTWTAPGGAALEGPIRLEVFDSAGRRVRMISLQERGPATDLEWDGQDETGRLVPVGLYELRVRATSGRSASRPVLILR